MLAILGAEELVAGPVDLLAKLGAVYTAPTTCAGLCWRDLTHDVQVTGICDNVLTRTS